MFRDGTTSDESPAAPAHDGALNGARRLAAGIVRAPGQFKRRLVRLIPVPDPDFDPLKATGEHAPRIREIVLQIGPMPGAAHRRGLEGPSGLAWG